MNSRTAGKMILAGLVSFGVVLVGLNVWISLSTPEKFLEESPIAKPNGDDLVVLIHAYQNDPDSLADLRDVVAEKLPNADVLAPQYDSRTFSNVRPIDIAYSVRLAIDEADRKRSASGEPYKRIILVGHSIGALIARKAYLDQLDRASRQQQTDSWAHRVDRLILFAGMNRGWSVDPRPEHMSIGKKVSIQAGMFLGRLSSTGRLIRDCERGQPFVANLRIQWMKTVRDEAINVAPVFQLLGGKDDVVSSADSMDLACADNFTFIETNGGHGSIIDLSEPDASGRRDIFQRLISEPDVAKLKQLGRNNKQVLGSDERAADHIVFLMHGIRDHAEWKAPLAAAIDRAWRAKHGEVEKLEIVTSEYGYFPMGSFLFGNMRQKKVRWFVDRYTEELAKTPKYDPKISFVGHSNGTYLVSKGLADYDSLKFANVVLCNSVAPTHYPWDERVEDAKVERLMNLRGSGDWVVAIFPNVFEQLLGTQSVIGSGGFYGFSDEEGHRHEHILVGSHGVGVEKDAYPFIADFIVESADNPPKELLTDGVDGRIKLLSSLSWLIFILLGVLIGGMGYLLARWLSSRPTRPVSPWLSVPVYALFVVAILQTI